MLQRIVELKNLGILDTEDEEIFDDIVKTASLVCEAPISLITLLDDSRQWFKASIGTDVKETPIEIAICYHTIQENDGQMLIEDLTMDDRFKDNPFVLNEPNLKSYLGISMLTQNGEKIGTVCVMDDKKRGFDHKQIACLNSLAKYAMKLIQEKVRMRNIENQNKVLKLLNKNMESFNHSIAHDVKAPLNIMKAFTKLVVKDETNPLNPKQIEYLGFVINASNSLSHMVNNLLEFSKKVQVNSDEFEFINLNQLTETVIGLLDYNKTFLNYKIAENTPNVFYSLPILKQAFQNVISNAIKYRDPVKEDNNLDITFSQDSEETRIAFVDNGIGISKDRLDELFLLFNPDSRVESSSGIGLCIVKEVLNRAGGKISVDSILGQGTTICISIPNSNVLKE